MRGLQRDRQWKLVFMHRENPLLHPSRSMCTTPLTVSKTSGAVIIPPRPPIVTLGTPEEMVNVRRLVGPAAVKCHLGRWTTQREDNYPPWESIKKSRFGKERNGAASGASWQDLCWSLSWRPVTRPYTRCTLKDKFRVMGNQSRDHK